jgi:2-methylcitrate dehydratase PrpD
MHLEACSHIGSIVISATLALAQRQKWSGDKILRAIIAGYEMAAVLGTAIRSQGTFNAHFRPSGLIGAFGAAAAAIAAEQPSEDIAVHALGYAVSMAAGTNEWAWSGGMEIFVEMGVASRSGIAAFDLANAGFESSDTALEGKDGLLTSVNAGDSSTQTFKEWLEFPIGKGIMDVRFKPVAGCNYAQTTSAVAVRIYQKYKPADIEKIKITATSQAVKYPGCNNTGPLNSIQNTKMSIQFGVCAALTFGKLDEDIFKRGNDPAVAKLISKCELGSSAEFDKMYQRGMQPASIEVTLVGGKVLSESAEDVPWLGESDVGARSVLEQSRDRSETASKKLMQACMDLKGQQQASDFLASLKVV